MPLDERSGLYFEEVGGEQAPTIVFLHGGGTAGWMWRHQVEFFKDRYHCLVPDLPEQGQSAAVGPFSVESAADLIAELILSRAHGGKAHVVGLSEGAQIVVSLLSRHPEVIDHAVSSSAILLPLPMQKIFYTHNFFVLSYRWFLAPFKNNDWWIRLNMHSAAGVGDEFYPEFKRSFQEMTQSGFVNLMDSNMNFRLPAHLEKVNVPVLVVAGKLEYSQMIQSARDLLAALPHAQGVLVSLGQGSSLAKEHNWAMTAPALFNTTVKAWIEDQPLPRELLPLKVELN